MSKTDLQIVAALLAFGADANKKCDYSRRLTPEGEPEHEILNGRRLTTTWVAGGSDTADATTGNINCGTVHGANILPFTTGQSTRDTSDAGTGGFGTAGPERAKCCQASCAITTFKAGADPGSQTVAGTATQKGTAYCGTDKLPLASATLATTAAHATSDYGTLSYPTATNADLCCQDACKTTNVEYKAGEGTNSGTSYFCGLNKVPNANQATLLSGAYSNSGSQTSQCCSDACGKVSFMAGSGTDDSAATKPKYFCGLNRGPVANQNSKPSGSNSVGATEKNTCCDDYCGKVTFSAGAGKDDTTTGSETYYCGADRVPVADQETTLAGTDSIGAGEKNTCCDDACGKVTFKAGKGKHDTKAKTYYCGENKVPKKKQGDIPSGSDAIGSGQVGTCCAAACSTAKYTAGKGTDKDTKYYCGEGRMPLADQKTLPCDGSKCTSSGKSNCCTATCSADKNKWAAGAKPKTPAKSTMYCGKGMVPKKSLDAVACTADPCDEATDAALCCEKPKTNNTTGTTAGASNAGLAAFTGVLVMGVAIFV